MNFYYNNRPLIPYMRILFFVYDTLYATIFLETPFWRRFGKNVSRIIYAKYDTPPQEWASIII